MNQIGMVQVFEQGRRNDTKIDFIDSSSETIAFTDERIKSIQMARLIESELRAYFRSDIGIARDWNNIFAAAYNFVNLYLENDDTKRQGLINQTYLFLQIPPNITVVEDLSDRSLLNKHNYSKSFFQLQEDIKRRYDDLTRSVVSNHIPEYDWN